MHIKKIIKDYAKSAVYSCVKLNLKEDESHKPIFIFATRRGGSTWAMELFSKRKEFLSISHPFSIYNNPKNLTFNLPIPRCGVFVDPNIHELEEIEKYLAKLINGEIIFNAKSRLWSSDFSFRPERVVLKITAAKSIYQNLEKMTDFFGIYITRHPLACALSCTRNKWGTTTASFLNSIDFNKRNRISKSLLSELKIIENQGNEIRRHVLNWAVENMDMVRLLKSKEGSPLHIYYEDLVTEPEEMLKTIFDYTKMTFRQSDLEGLQQPSGSTKGKSEKGFEKLLNTGQTNEIANGWQKKVGSDEIDFTYDLLSKMDIDLYSHHNHDLWKRSHKEAL